MPQQIMTWIVCALVLISAVWVVALRNLFRAALSLGIVLVGVAALFLLLEAEFLAFVQILVYVGAILPLVVFAVMLTSRATASAQTAISRHRGPAALVSGALFGLLCSATQPLLRVVPASPHPFAETSDLGKALITTFVLPFEVISILLVTAMVGAIAVAASHPKSEVGSRKSEAPGSRFPLPPSPFRVQ